MYKAVFTDDEIHKFTDCFCPLDINLTQISVTGSNSSNKNRPAWNQWVLARELSSLTGYLMEWPSGLNMQSTIK